MRPKKSTRLLSIAALSLATTIVPASALISQAHAQTVQIVQGDRQPQNLFEALFPKLIDQRLQRQQPIEPVEVVKVSAPQYYKYTAQKLVKVDLSALIPSPGAGEIAEQPEPAAFEVGEDETSPDTHGVTDSDNITGSVEESPAEAAYEKIAAGFGLVSVMTEPEIAKAITEHYKNNPGLLWLSDDLSANAWARSVLPVLASAGQYGLDADDYDIGLRSGSDPMGVEAAANFEILMTARVIRYAMDAQAGRINPNKLSGYHDFPEDRANAQGTLKKLVSGSLPARTLVSFHPDNAQFEALKKELAGLDQEVDGLIVIPAKILIKPGETHEEVPNILAAIAKRGSPELAIRVRDLVITGEDQNRFTPEVVEVVKAFQEEASLVADGVVGPNTVAKLTDVDPQTKRQRILLAMERLRWHPHNLGERRVFINQPAYQVRYFEDDKTKLEMRVVVGKRSNQTNFFYDEIETVEYNPYWGIPRSILVNEYLPKLRANPAYLDERGYEVTDRQGRRVASSAIDWNQVGSKPQFDVRQRPGERNALGQLKILFPNKHAIYMHDTPAKNLFDRSQRAYSHGCVRLQYPKKMAAAVLGKTVAHVDAQIGSGQHSDEKVAGNIPVYVAYFTAWPNDAGKVEYFADVYGRDDQLMKAVETTRKSRAVTS